jgi:hypothetical protein
VLDSIRYDNLWNSSKSNISDCNKRSAYGRYLCSESLRHLRLNASLGQSCLSKNDKMKDDPFELNNDSNLSDSIYGPDESKNIKTTTSDMKEEIFSSDEEGQR